MVRAARLSREAGPDREYSGGTLSSGEGAEPTRLGDAGASDRYADIAHARVELGGAAFLQGNRFSVDSTANTALDNVGYTVGHAGLISGVRLSSGLWLNGYGGHTFFRRFEVFDERDDKLSELDINNTWVAKVTLEFRVDAPG